MFMKNPQQLTNHLIEWYGFGLVVFVADRLSDCRYLSRCCSPLDSQRVRCRAGLAMKSFSDRPFRVNAIPRHRRRVLVHRSLRRVPRRYVRAIHVQWGSDTNGRARCREAQRYIGMARTQLQ